MATLADSGAAVVGKPAPDFTLPSNLGRDVSVSEFKGRSIVVLYFYPKDYTPGCTAEACGFRDEYEVFKKAGAEVIGVSADSIRSHEGFAAKHSLPFILLSDGDGVARKLYGAQPFGILPKRVTFVIDREGIVRLAFSTNLSADRHVTEALELVRELASS